MECRQPIAVSIALLSTDGTVAAYKSLCFDLSDQLNLDFRDMFSLWNSFCVLVTISWPSFSSSYN